MDAGYPAYLLGSTRPFEAESIRQIPARCGVYELSRKGGVEYVGSSNNLRKRLLEHLNGRSHSERLRKQLLVGGYQFRFTVTNSYQALESLLIHTHEQEYGFIPALNQLKTGSMEVLEKNKREQELNPDAITILFVDDAPVTRSVYQQQLEEQGYRVLLAGSAQQTRQIVREEKPQLAIIDYYMPDQNGDELTRELLSDPESCDLLIVIHSQYPEALERCLEAGAVDFIYKEEPIDIFLLRIRSLHKYLKNAQQQHEQALLRERQEREYVENIIATLSDGLIITDAEGAIDLINPAVCHLLGWDAEALKGRRLVEMVTPPVQHLIGEGEDHQRRLQALYDRNPEGFWRLMDYALLPLVAVDRQSGNRVWVSPRAKQLLDQESGLFALCPVAEQEIMIRSQQGEVVLQQVADPQQEDLREISRLSPFGGVVDQQSQNEERELIDRHGELIPVLWSGALLRNPQFGIRGALFSFRDLRPQRLQEQQRRVLEREHNHAQKMASVGTLAGGVAHEFNNMLQPIMGFSALLLEEEQKNRRLPDKDRERLEMIHQSARKGSELVRQILDFSRKDQQLPEQVYPLNTLLETALKMFRATRPPTVSLLEKVSLDLGEVRINSTEFHQILLNLFGNALQAIEAAHVESGVVTLQARRNDEESHCEVTVADNGEGVSEAIRKQIFDPFFTTRPVGKGSGMGLSVVLGIVERAGGQIVVESEPGEGARFLIRLPLA
ncbi:MAG: response regulator [Gammaproteobacteria bacterium]|nr:response regulator [Gammaproteobacteria bacterium]MBT3490561.1 response regulator [Gammaproteobacteria bacterium]MBT3844456.1 response regulator [Gammaproteobacteria bacterium]MBT3893609.1 response regulator [Gammaproteobacteria bacterium]MBT4788942.1 response regulator [Gammaproteobacteria bacterium]